MLGFVGFLLCHCRWGLRTNPMKPSMYDVKQARLMACVHKNKAGLTQRESAKIISVSLRAWQYWESGKIKMPVSKFELFLIKTGQYPDPNPPF